MLINADKQVLHRIYNNIIDTIKNHIKLTSLNFYNILKYNQQIVNCDGYVSNAKRYLEQPKY